MDSPSQWEWPWKLLALVLFGLAVAAVWWIARQIFYVWLPDGVAAALGFCIGAFCLGVYIGQWSVTRKLRRESASDRR